MENNNNSKKRSSQSSINQINQITDLNIVKRYPFNGRSKYLIDRFYIMGFRPNQIHKIIFQNSQNIKLLQNISKKTIQEEAYNPKSQFNPNFQKNHQKKLIVDELPSLLNEISSDMKKELPDINLIKNMLFPNKINFYIKTDTIKKTHLLKRYTINNDNLIFNKINSAPLKIDPDENNNFIGKKNNNSENNNLKMTNSKQYNMVFSYNPQSGTNSKKSINGFAYVFYKEFKEKQEINNVKFSFYVPVTFCIISEFPFFNSYYKLCKQIVQLFQSNKNEIPLEILIYNIINFSLSPINGEILLNIEPTHFPTRKIVVNSLNKAPKEKKEKKEKKEENIQMIKEEEEPEEDYNNPFDLYEADLNNKNNINNNVNNNNNIDKKKEEENLYKKIAESPTLKPRSIFQNINNNINNNNTNQKNDLRNSEKINGKMNISPEMQKKKKSYFNQISRNTISLGANGSNLLNFEDDIEKDNNIENNRKILSAHEDIKFQFLSGYPLIQYNLSKVLLHKLSAQDVIIIFFYSFLEKDILFFSKHIEYLSLTINSYLNLNFPLNDEKYYFFNACVSYDNFINDNSPFVGATFTSILGINSSYNSDYLNKIKPKEHLAVDLDKGIIYFNEDPNDKEKNLKNKTLFDYIKKICRKEIKDDKGIIFVREVKILYDKLEIYKNENLSIESQNLSINGSLSTKTMLRVNNKNSNGYNNFIDYDDRGQNSIKIKNRIIQESFYRLVNYISLYFYQNLSLKSDDDKEDLKKIIINRKNKGLNADTMNIIFNKDYNTDENNYTKEEIYLLDELMDTMKFESFVYGFIQSYNPIDLYKIPLTLTEEFLSILSRKNSLNHLNFNFFNLIDNIYKKKGIEKIFIDFNPFSSEYYNKIKKYFDREIFDGYNKSNISCRKIFKEKFVKAILTDNEEGKIINNLKYTEFILDNNILLKYIRYLKNTKKEDYYHMFHLASNLDQNKIKNISITDIENEIEKYCNNLDILPKRDICCSNIILLFILNIKTIKNYIDCQPFLSALFQNLNVFRKYYTMIMNLVYRLMNECLEKNDYINAKNYFFCYYSCINSLRASKLVPNENLMNIILKFDKIDLNYLLEKSNNSENVEEVNKVLNEHMEKYSKKNINKNIYLIYNFMKNSFVKEKSIIQKVNELKGETNLNWNVTINKEANIEKKIQPKIKYNNGIFQYECFIYPQDLILENLNKQYEIYSKNLDESQLDNKVLFEACLNIILFMRNSDFFSNNDDLTDAFKVIFNVYFYKIINMNKPFVNNENK